MDEVADNVFCIFSHAPDEAVNALDTLAGVDAELVVPGHGPPWRGTPAAAAHHAHLHPYTTATL